MTPLSHPGDELQLLLDEGLTPERRAEIEAHLAECARCRSELSALRRVRTSLRQDLAQQPVPAELAERVSRALGAETARMRRRRRRFLVGVPLAVAALLVLFLVRQSEPDLVSAAARDLAGWRANALYLDLKTAEPAALEQHFAGAGIAFPTRVFDFGMMGYRLAGGRVHRLAGRRSALFAYQNDRGERLLCQMFEGAVAELPPPGQERDHDGIRFLVYRTAGLTLVFWQEGPVICVLVAEGDPEAAVQLAYAKAVKV
jgi:anti-sigma factor RsiW